MKFSLSKIESSGLRNRYLKIHQDDQSSDITVLIECKYPSTSEMHKEKLVHILKRLEGILKNKCYVLGSGHIENYLYNKLTVCELDMKLDNGALYDHVDAEETSIYVSLIKKIFSNTFRDMFLMTENNSGSKFDNLENKFFYDDLESKLEAWRLGCFINKCFIQSDFSINF
jgi:hypothetical protein